MRYGVDTSIVLRVLTGKPESLATAKPGFLDRVIHGTYVPDDKSVPLTCEKDARKLMGV